MPARFLTLLAALLLPLGASPASAAPPTASERGTGLEAAALASSEAWTDPDGTRIRVGGQYAVWGLSYRAPFTGMIAGRYQGSLAAITRSDTEAPLKRLGSRLDLAWSRSWSHALGLGEDYRIALGIGMLADHQIHLDTTAPSGRARDYLDEAQLRLGPTIAIDLTWMHPQDDAWRATLHLLGAPHLIGYSTGNVAFPRQWAAFEATLGPTWRAGPIELSAVAEGRLWQGAGFTQRAAGGRFGATWRF